MPDEVFEVNLKDIDKKDAWKQLQKFMDELYDSMSETAATLAIELNVSEGCAVNILYLRSRSRWTEDLEQQLIEMDKKGIQPNMCEFPKK